MSLGRVAALLLLAGCAAAEGTPAPIALSYPDALEADAVFAGFNDVARRLAGSYVRVLVYSESNGVDRPAREIVNGASGTIVDGRGYVITTAHIAKDVRYRAEITTVDGWRRPGRILHVDPARELALLKIDPFPGLRAASPADSAPLRIGQPALSIGTPDNTPGTVSLGSIIEPRRARRVVYAEYGYDDAIILRMDVAPGHSGGPVFDGAGRLIGMIASFGLGDTRHVPYAPMRIAYAVPASAIRAYLAAHVPP